MPCSRYSATRSCVVTSGRVAAPPPSGSIVGTSSVSPCSTPIWKLHVDTYRFPPLTPPSGGSFTPDVDASTVRRSLLAAGVRSTQARWDLLLVCVAGYILMAVGRIHQLFPV